MEAKGRIDVKSLSDLELKEQLASHGILGVVIMPSTRGVYERKLTNLRDGEQRNEASSGCHDAQNGSVSSDSVLPVSTIQAPVSSSDSVSRDTDSISSNADLVSSTSSTDSVSSSTDPVSSSIDSVSSNTDPISSNANPVSSSTDPVSNIDSVSSNTDPVSSSTDPVSSNTDSVSKPTPLYFAVATSTSTPEETRSSLSPFYHDHKDLIKAIKGSVGARFKKFSDQSKAEEFSKRVFPEELGPKYSLERALSPLPSVKKTRDKNVLAKIIQEGNVEEFLKTVWGNPRYLLGSGDTPEIIHPGTRRNALHLATLYNQLEICKQIMSIIQNDRFWVEVYPVSDVLIDAAMSSSEKKNIEGMDMELVREGKREYALRLRQESKSRLVDLYLNIQDGNERAKVKVSEKHYTPLHIASMYGFVDIVEFLMSFPATDTTKKDNQGRTAADLACSKCSKPSEELKSKIKYLINNPSIYYVPVIRSIDNTSPASLGSPFVLEDSSIIHSQSLDESFPHTGSPQIKTSPLVGQAFAGPLSPAKAMGMLKEWKSPSHSDLKKKATLMKRSDPDRGLERVGRLLAHKDGIGWTEYWEFLGSYADLSKPDGLRKLDKHIFTLSHSIPLMTPSVESVRISSGNRTRSRLSLLTNEADSPKQQLFADEINKDEEVGVVSNGDHAHSKPTTATDESEDPLPLVSSIEPHPSLEEGFERMNLNEDSSPLKSEPETIEYSFKTPSRIDKSNAVYIDGGPVPSKLDHDVLLALCGVEVDVREYPHVYQWKRLVESYSEQEQKQWATPRSLNRHFRRTEESVRPFSPLVYYSPPPLSPLLSNSPSSARRTPLPFKNFPLTPQYRMSMTTPTKTWF